MNFTATSMFGQLIWGSDPRPELVDAAKRAGWTAADLNWETLQERGNQSLSDNDPQGAARNFRRARWIATLRFPKHDLRRATSLANLGVLDVLGGQSGRGRRRLLKAKSLWDRHADAAVQAMTIAPRARSSLFHLRMEARHRDTYEANMKKRIAQMAAETRESLQAYLDGGSVRRRHYDRWIGERPAVYDDTRKVLAACLLLAVVQVPGIRGSSHADN